MSTAAIVTMLAGSSVVSTTSAFMVSMPPLIPDVVRPSSTGSCCRSGLIGQTSSTELAASLGGSSHNRGIVGSENYSCTRSPLYSNRHRSCGRDAHGRHSQTERATRCDSDSPDFTGSSSTDHDEPIYRRTKRSRENQLIRHSSTTSTSECKNSPTEDSAWRQSVFEFKGLNDPETNLASGARRQNDGDDIPDAMQAVVQSGESAAKDLASSIEDALFSGETQSPDWFQFREKEALRRAEVDDKVKELRGSYAATVDLATQLGLPASASFEEIRSAYRQEIKRCHPDAAGVASNEFRLKALERRFQRLTASWDAFVVAHKDPSAYPGPVSCSNPTMNAVAAAVAKRAAKQQAECESVDSSDVSEGEQMDVGSSSC